MVNVTIKKDEARTTMTMRGHATGNPEVCTACSTLWYVLSGYMQMYGLCIKASENSGSATIIFQRDVIADAVCKAIEICFARIAKQYPENVHFASTGLPLKRDK